MNYNRALDLIFESYIAVKPLLKGRLDRDVRNPHIILNIARQLDLIPPADKILKVTGSKGKGTVARLCASSLEPFGKVGLVISPEEIDHTDRMRINGQPMSEDRFIACFEKIWAQITIPSAPDYLSPYGLFLLIALQWFKEENVDLFVIETGRGVRFDEGGQIPAHTGVVTSIFFEHADYLGPTLDDIRADKLSISETCDHLVIGARDTKTPNLVYPHWYDLARQSATEALRAFRGRAIDIIDVPCASFATRQDANRTLMYEGMIARDSADEPFLRQLMQDHNGQVHFYLSLPDDKDFDGIMDLLQKTGATISQIILTGERGFLSYEKAKQHQIAYQGDFNDVCALKSGLDLPQTGLIYFIGTQTYLRLIKRAYFT